MDKYSRPYLERENEVCTRVSFAESLCVYNEHKSIFFMKSAVQMIVTAAF